jgi:hypothetical protein
MDGLKAGDKGSKSDPSATATSTSTSTKTKTKTNASGEEEANGAAAALDTPGLPDGCAARPGAGQLCITCKPRDLPITQCGQSSLASFDPEAQCSHDLDQLVCDFGDDETFTLDLEKRSPIEEIYDRVPLLIFGAKLLLGSKLDNLPAEKEALYKVLDLLQSHRLDLFTCGDITPLIDEIAAVAEDYNPAFSTEQMAGFKTQAAIGATAFTAACKLGQISDQGVITAAAAVLKALPAGLGDRFGNIDLTGVLAALSAGGGLEGGLASILNGQDLGAILGSIEVANNTAVSTSSATSTAVSTGTGTASASTASATSTSTSTSTSTAQ